MVMMMLVKAVTLMVIRRDLMLMVMTLDDNRKTANADQTVKGNVGENQGNLALEWSKKVQLVCFFHQSA